MTRLLYILPGFVPPDRDPALDKFTYLSEIAQGEVLLPVWWDSENSASPFLRETFPVYRRGTFIYHLFLAFRFPPLVRRLAILFFYVHRGLQLHRKARFDVIKTWGTNLPGLAGVILKWITGSELIVEIPSTPEDAYRFDTAHANAYAGIRRFLADQLLFLVCTNADCIKLLYPWQIGKYPRLIHKPTAVFHDLVAVHTIAVQQTEEPFVLLAGYPWYRKGVDILIQAFKLIACQFPNYKLKLMGYYPDREYLNTLAGDCPQIEFLAPRPHEPALKVISACCVYVSASRSEGMPRVLLEAMAARKPIVSSAVSGVPYYIKDNDNGLLFQSENVEELAKKLAILLSSPELRARLAKSAYDKVMSEYDERAYVHSFQNMLQSLGDKSLQLSNHSD
jgi:glycosyltransferase involved in cell wall biosynthesis